jgi:hypothetical protein
MMAREVMDFPDPDSPTKPSTSPGAMVNERLRTASALEADGVEAERVARDCGK